MKGIKTFALLFIAVSINAAQQGAKEPRPEGLPNSEQPGQVQQVVQKVSTVREPEELPSGDSLIRIKTLKNDNAEDSFTTIHQVIRKEQGYQVFSRLAVGQKYAGKVDKDFLELVVQRERHLMFGFLEFLKSRDEALASEFLQTKGETTSTTVFKEAKKNELG